MATKRKLQVRYGAAASRPTLSTGELGLDTDTGSEALYIGTPAGNKKVMDLPYSAATVKRYVALVTQSGTSAPVETILENTLGVVTYTYNDIGDFIATSSSLFTSNKTVCSLSQTETGMVVCKVNSATEIGISTFDIFNESANGKITNAMFQILVYP